MRAGADLRLLRAAVFAAACVALASAGHLSATGPALPLWAPVAGWLLILAVTAFPAGRERRSLPGLAAALAAAQLALHCLFSVAQGHAAGPDPLAMAGRLLCNDHAAGLTEAEAVRIVLDAGLPMPAAPGIAEQAGQALGSLVSGPMLTGHLLAALATGWVLTRGEAALWKLIRLSARRPAGGPVPRILGALRAAVRLARALCGPLLPPAAPLRPRRPGHHHATPATEGVVLPDTVIRRGPPPAAGPFSLAA